MDFGKSNKIKVTADHLAQLEKTETELRDLIRGPGFVPKSVRAALDVVQDILCRVEVVKDDGPTWDGPQPPRAA